MSDMIRTVVPKSDQTNADDLIGGPITIRITGASVGSGDQPVSLNYEGDNGKPFKPCKSMRRVLILLWGNESKAYIGRSMTIYRDPSVKFGGEAVGGIRISHMSHIEKALTMALTATKGKRTPYTVQPLTVGTSPTLADVLRKIEAAKSLDELKTIVSSDGKRFTDADERARITDAKDKRKEELSNQPNPMENVK